MERCKLGSTSLTQGSRESKHERQTEGPRENKSEGALERLKQGALEKEGTRHDRKDRHGTGRGDETPGPDNMEANVTKHTANAKSKLILNNRKLHP